MGLTPEELKKLVKHKKYYIPSADLSFLLGHVQFRVHRYFFERESEFYCGRLTVPVSPGATRHGSSDSDPLVLEDVKAEDFEKLCWVFYNTRYSLYDASVDDWSVILSLAHKWGFGEVKALAVRELEKKEFLDVDRVAVYQNNAVDRNLLIPRFAALCARESPLTLEEGLKLGMETTLVIASAREYVRSAKSSDGGRTPITPTVQGDELYNVIRELFGIPPAPVPKADEKAKDEPKASASSASEAKTNGSATAPTPTSTATPAPIPTAGGPTAEGAKPNPAESGDANVNGTTSVNGGETRPKGESPAAADETTGTPNADTSANPDTTANSDTNPIPDRNQAGTPLGNRRNQNKSGGGKANQRR